MIEEKTPQYFKEFMNSFNEFKVHIDKRFDLVDQKIEKEVGELAASTAKEFAFIYQRFDRIDKKLLGMEFEFDTVNNQLYNIDEKIGKIEKHIGRYEIRAQNIEHILEKDQKVSIRELEKVVFGI